ncbi:MAG: putative LPS assembly protein LptD [Bacteroidia bacterium]
MKPLSLLLIPYGMLIACLCGLQPLQAQDSSDSRLVYTPPSPDSSQPVPRKIFKSALDDEVTYSARDSIKIRVKDQMIFLYGDAMVKYKTMEIKAAMISINFKTQTMYAVHGVDTTGVKFGMPHFKDEKDEMITDSLKYNFKSKKGIIYGLVTAQADGLVYGEIVKKDSANNMYISKARYTTCTDTAHPHFYIQANRMKIIPGKKIISGPAFFFVGDVPTPAVLPFGYFPITRGQTSGIIMPNYGYSQDRGYFLRNGGYYFGISDRLDFALTGDIYANGSWRGQATSFYAKRYKYSGNASLSYAVNKNNEPEDPDYFKSKDFLFNWTHLMDNRARPKTNFSASVQLGSSSYLRTNSYNPSDMVKNTMNSSINYSRSFRVANLNMTGRHSQNTNTGNVDVTLPDIIFDVYRFFPFRGKNYSSANSKFYQDIGITYSTKFRNQLNTGDSTFFTPQSLTALQYGVNHQIGASGNFKLLKYLAFSPAANYTEYWYFQSTQKSFDKTENAVKIDTNYGYVRGYEYNFSANLRTMIYGMYAINGKKISAIRHVMTPALSFSYRPDFSKPEYGFYKKVATDATDTNFATYSIFEKGIFNGPGAGKSGVLGMSLVNNLEAKVRDKSDTLTGFRKVKILDVFSVATSYNLLADSLNLAPVVIELRTILFKYFNLQFNTSYSVYGYRIDSTAVVYTAGFLKDQNGKLARMLNTRVYITTSLNSETLKGKATPGRLRPYMHPYMTSQELIMLNSPDQFVDFNIPWNFNLNYVYNVNKTPLLRSELQTLNFSGDFSLTPKWKIGFNSGYDITNKQITMTTLNLYRDLHCWEFRFDWMPFGDRQYFAFAMNAKSSVLQDLKLNRRRDWYDK